MKALQITNERTAANCKVKRYLALRDKSPQSYEASRAIGDHSVICVFYLVILVTKNSESLPENIAG